MLLNKPKVLTLGVSTFNTKTKTEFNAGFNQGDFEDLEIDYFEGTESSELDWSKDWDSICDKIMGEINSIQDFINDDCRTYFTLVCENNLIQVTFHHASPDLDGPSYRFTIINEKGKEVISGLEMMIEDDDDDDEDHYDEDDYNARLKHLQSLNL